MFISILILITVLLNANNLISFFGKNIMQFVVGIVLIINLLSILTTFISAFILFKRKKIIKGLILTLTSLLFLSLYVLLIVMGFSESPESTIDSEYESTYEFTFDHFADSLTIPKNVNINTPLNVEFIDIDNVKNREKLKLKKTSTFYLLSLGGLGMYEYDIYVNKIDKGEVYLKAFEITKGTKLSEESLKKESTIKIFNPNNRLKRFGTVNKFFIDEGDEGKPYAARFEVWYKPYLGKEKKLYSKNYIIEGFQPD
jgi:hypothetical protein